MREKAFGNIVEITSRIWPGVENVWLTSQTIFKGVNRWKSFPKSRRRVQNDLQHSYSLPILAKIFLEKIGLYNPHLDKELIINCALLHDHGEGELKRDISWSIKTGNDDLDEYLAFRKRYSQLGVAIFETMEEAYLLQYCLGEIDHFPPEAKIVLERLKKRKRQEAMVFSAIEVWDYLLYAFEQNRERKNRVILKNVTKNQLPRIDYFIKNIAGVSQEIWTEEIIEELKKILK